VFTSYLKKDHYKYSIVNVNYPKLYTHVINYTKVKINSTMKKNYHGQALLRDLSITFFAKAPTWKHQIV